MLTFYLFTKYFHAALGVAALLAFWTAALARKGGPAHRLAGRVYVVVMVGLLLAAIPLSAFAFEYVGTGFALFLFYLLLITATALWRAWTAVRRKRDFASYAGPGFRRLGWANVAAGAVILGVGAVGTQPVLLGFSLVGILGGRGMLRLAADGPGETRWWLREHLGAILGCGVATHIAFLLIGLPRLLPASWNGPALNTFGWLAPLAIAALAGRLLGRKYLPASSTPSPSPMSPATTLRNAG